jgi:hypothetical protein
VATYADIISGAGVLVITCQGIAGEHATTLGITSICGADVAIITWLDLSS